jgi:hypothetical protein
MRERRMALQMGSAATKSSPRRSAPPEDLPVMALSDSHAQRRSSTRSLPSLRLLEDALTDLRQTNAHYSSVESATLAGKLSELSRR